MKNKLDAQQYQDDIKAGVDVHGDQSKLEGEKCPACVYACVYPKPCEEDHNGRCYFCGRNMLSQPQSTENWQAQLKAFLKDQENTAAVFSPRNSIVSKNALKSFIFKARLQAHQEGYKEAIEKIIDELETNPNEDGSVSPNLQHWIERKKIQLRKLLALEELESNNKNK